MPKPPAVCPQCQRILRAWACLIGHLRMQCSSSLTKINPYIHENPQCHPCPTASTTTTTPTAMDRTPDIPLPAVNGTIFPATTPASISATTINEGTTSTPTTTKTTYDVP
ncbi:unnamed protein product [Schistocephalus solidus]|uniref:C2H2-type domain-containing protein n=1 Tax=Schistocephalus solidus TaxID=70667 RepID=A0A183SLG8_SCHSO|nr:unnamed protein product [Schistocephalus solidus]